MEPRRSRKYSDDEDWAPSVPVVTTCRVTRSQTGIITPNRKYYDLEESDHEDDTRSENTIKNCSSHSVTGKPLAKISNSESNVKKNSKISDYELQIQKNIEERKKMFEMLNLGSAKQELGDLFSFANKRKTDDDDGSDKPAKKRGRPFKRNEKLSSADEIVQPKLAKKKQSPTRRTSRARKPVQYFDYQQEEELSLPKCKQRKADPYYASEKYLPSRVRSIQESVTPKTRVLRSCRLASQTLQTNRDPHVLTFENTYADKSLAGESSRFLKEVTPFLTRTNAEDGVQVQKGYDEFINTMRTLKLSSSVSIVQQKITSLTWHPNSSKLLLAAGDVSGSIGFLDVEQQSEMESPMTPKRFVHVYDVHSSHVTGLTFDIYNPTRLLSTSKDGFVRLVDFTAEIFHPVYSSTVTSKNVFPTHLIQKRPASVIIARADGQVITVDLRTEPWREDQKFKCFKTSIPTLSSHPLDDNLFMASCINGETNVFDLRNMKATYGVGCENPVIQLPKLSSKIDGAFFSPLTGEHAIVTGRNFFQIFDLRGGTCKVVDNWDSTCYQENSDLSLAQWHPQREDVFIAAHNDDYQQQVAIFCTSNGKCLHSFENGTSQSVGFSTFHPTVPILASGSSISGQVNLFSSV